MPSKSLITADLIAYRNKEFTIGKVIDYLVRELPDAEIYHFNNNSSYVVSKIPRKKKRGKGHVMVSMSRKMETVLYVFADGEYTYPAESIHVLMCSSYLKKEDLSVIVRLSRPESRSFKLTHKALDNTTTAEQTLVRSLYAPN